MELAALVHRPLIDLEAEPGLAPSVLAEAARLWAIQPARPAWAPDQRPRAMLVARLPRAALPEPILARIAAAATPGERLWAARLWLQLGRLDKARAQLSRVEGGTVDDRGWRAVWRAELDGVGRVVVGEGASPAVRLAAVLDALDRGVAGPGGLDEARAIAGQLGDRRLARLAIGRVLVRELALREVHARVVDELVAAIREARRGADPWLDFLLRETALRLHRAALAQRIGELAENAAAAIALDPHGAETQLAAADAYGAIGLPAEASAGYAAAARFALQPTS